MTRRLKYWWADWVLVWSAIGVEYYQERYAIAGLRPVRAEGPRRRRTDEEKAVSWWASWRKAWKWIAAQYWADNWPKD